MNHYHELLLILIIVIDVLKMAANVKRGARDTRKHLPTMYVDSCLGKERERIHAVTVFHWRLKIGKSLPA